MKLVITLLLAIAALIGCGGGASERSMHTHVHSEHDGCAGAHGTEATTSTETVTATTGAGGATAATPNILLVIIDDLGAESSSLYPSLNGPSGAVAMPNLEALAAQGLVFDRAYSNPTCSPTRSTIVSGRYGHHTGVTHISHALPTDTVTLFDRLGAETSYEQAFFGKYHLGGDAADMSHLTAIGVPYYKVMLHGSASYYSWMLHSSDPPGHTTETTYATTAHTDYAIDFIGSATAPWFTYLAYTAPHEPFEVPPSHLHSVDLGEATPGTVLATLPNYKAMTQSLDTELGRLFAAVDLDETTVIVLADNGTPSAMVDKPSGVRGWKNQPYEGGIRVPLVIAGAGVTRTGEREDALVQTADLYATILELAGLDVPQVYNSHSIAPLLTDSMASSGRTHVFAEGTKADYTSHTYSIQDGRWKLIWNGNWRLYDLETNPLETSDKYPYSAYDAQKAALHAALDALAAEAPPGFFP